MRRFTIVFFVLASLLPATLAAQDDWGEETACAGALDLSLEELAQVLAKVPKYGSTYVVVTTERVTGEIESIESPALQDIEIAVYEDSPAVAIAEQAGLTVKRFPFAAGQIVDELLAGNADAAVLWSPLAGLGAFELDFNYELSFRTTGAPAPPPSDLQVVAASGDESECAAEIGGTLEGYGVVPAEKLVPLDIRDFLHLPAPPRDLEAAMGGKPLYAEHCAKCHGPEGVAATDALAPVDLLVSVRRFSYPGFLYIVLNGRSQNGMPGFRGSLDRELVEQIYLYVRERSQGEIAASAGSGP